MATPSEKLAESLEVLHRLQESGMVAIRSKDLTRTHRERLQKGGFLHEVVRGWYIPTRPDEPAGESTAWYAAFWPFCVAYLDHLKDKKWCLSPEQSLSLHAENWTVPVQLLIRAEKARNNITPLLHDTSMLVIRAALPDKKDIQVKQGLNLYTLPAALIACNADYFKRNPTDTRAALSMIDDASELLVYLLEGGNTTIAGRLAGGFRNIGRDRIANEIVSAMRSAGYDVRETDPYKTQLQFTLSLRARSPYVNRIRIIWQEMREHIINKFPAAPKARKNVSSYLKSVEEIYVTDAYHSLSIEGYRVSAELIERVRSGNWDPDLNEQDREHQNALAARGYWQAYQVVRKSIEKVLRNENPGHVADLDHSVWYQEMFASGVTAGILRPGELAGYRNAPVYIRRSMHVPPSSAAARDAMPTFFELLTQETEASVRIVLGHFIFVYIHPYIDGNGRIARFLMNVMLAAGGYPWTIIPLEKRTAYMSALEEASVRQNIVPFANYIACLVDNNIKGKALPKAPNK